jgi:AcrR family transcriptional regulator
MEKKENQNVREDIVEAAIVLSGIKGIKFTTDELAHELGMSKRTLYKYFSSKEDILHAIIDKFLDRVKTKEDEIIANVTLSDLEKIKAILNIFVKDFRIVYINNFLEMKYYYPNEWKRIELWLDSWNPPLDLIQKEIERGNIRKVNIVVLRHMVKGCLFSLVDKKFLYNNNLTIQDAYKSMIDIFLNGVLTERG